MTVTKSPICIVLCYKKRRLNKKDAQTRAKLTTKAGLALIAFLQPPSPGPRLAARRRQSEQNANKTTRSIINYKKMYLLETHKIIK